MRGLFDTRSMVQGWLDAEAALAAAEAEVGVIPSSAAQRIRREARADLYDLEALRHGIAESQHPLVPLIRALANRCGDAGAYVHWGATTQDIMDTGMVLQVRAALPRLLERVASARCSCARLAGEYATSPMAARTHGQQAVPTTFGLKAAGWADELSRVADRLAGARETISVAQLGGADADRVLGAFCATLELTRPDVPWFAARDRIRDLAHALGEFGAAAERIAAELIRLQATEVGELAEGAGEARVGSSTMPQKQNPMMSEYLVASTRLLRGAIGTLADAVSHAGERDMGLWAVEWLALPQAFILAGGAAEKLEHLLANLEVDDARMRANLSLAGGAIMAEAAMMAVARVIGHEKAHVIVTAASRQARVEQRQMLDVLAEQPEAALILDAALIERLRDPGSYLGWSAELAADASTRDGAAATQPNPERSNNG